jgi:hypothetical protein
MALAPQAKAYYRIDCSRPPTACDRLRRGAWDWGLYCESSLQGRTGVSFLTGRLPGLLRGRSRCHACLIAQFTLSVSPSSTQLSTDLRVHSSDPSKVPVNSDGQPATAPSGPSRTNSQPAVRCSRRTTVWRICFLLPSFSTVDTQQRIGNTLSFQIHVSIFPSHRHSGSTHAGSHSAQVGDDELDEVWSCVVQRRVTLDHMVRHLERDGHLALDHRSTGGFW